MKQRRLDRAAVERIELEYEVRGRGEPHMRRAQSKKGRSCLEPRPFFVSYHSLRVSEKTSSRRSSA